MKKIAIIISTPMIFRNYVHTNLCESIAKNNEVTLLISRKLIDEISKVEKIKLSNNIKIVKVDNNKKGILYIIYRILSLCHDAKLYDVSNNKRKIVNDIYNNRNKSIIKILSFFKIDSIAYKLFKNIFVYFSKRNKDNETFDFDILISTLPQEFFDFSVIHDYSSRYCDLIYHIFSWDNITSRGPLIVAPQKIFVWNNYVKNEIINYYDFIKTKIHIVSVPFYDFFISNNDKICIIKNEENYILYTTGETDYLDYEPELVYQISKMIMTNFPKYQLKVRLHPCDKMNNYQDKKFSGIEFIEPSKNIIKVNNNLEYYCTKNDFIDYIHQLSSASLILNIASTVAIDSIILGKLSAGVNFMPEGVVTTKKINDNYTSDHYRNIIKLNLFPNLKSIEDLGELINNLSDDDYQYESSKINEFKNKFLGFDDAQHSSNDMYLNALNE